MDRLEEYIRNTYENDKIENYKKMIIELSENYNINSKYTSLSDLDIPRFLRKNKNAKSNYTSEERRKTDREVLKEKVGEYYNKFIVKDEKSILTYLLFAVYYLSNRNNIFNYNDLLIFLNENKENILSTDIYKRLIYLCYSKLETNRLSDKKETLELLDEDYKKIAITNLKINIDLKILTDTEVKDIINNDKIIENIDDIIWYLYDGERSQVSVSWL